MKKNQIKDISQIIWEIKYKQERESSIEQTLERVAEVASGQEKDKNFWRQEFLKILTGFQFIPGGRILANAGNSTDSTLINCFVMGKIDDSIDGIFSALKEGALTMQMGGGVGYDFSTIRPTGSEAHRAGNLATGPVSFMKIWDVMCETMLTTGNRRGAMMACLRCDHPDIEQFIQAKHEKGVLTNFNISVLITDAFLNAVANDLDWDLKFENSLVSKSIKARKLWDQILRCTYELSEPGVLFIDRINKSNNLYYCEKIMATNPCGELPLPPYGACNLGSINLTAFVSDAFSDKARIDWERLEKVVPVAVRFLDNIVDSSRYPLAMQRDQALKTRRLGLGITGLADTLIMLGLHYAQESGRQIAEKIMQKICYDAYKASCALAKEKGCFPSYDETKVLAAKFIKQLPEDIQHEIKRHGLRNGHLLSIAPTGTISLLAHNVSSGIEPVFSFEQQRNIIDESKRPQQYNIQDYAYKIWKQLNPASTQLPNYFCTATELTAKEHLLMQAALQKFVDSSISKTINVSAKTSFDEFKSVYDLAYQLGLKGCTTYRPSSIRGEVLKAIKCENEC